MPRRAQNPPKFAIERDRDASGRPEQRRPRDRTGRPLPYGTTTEVFAEDHAPETIADAVALATRLWREQRYFEAHECLEFVWHAAHPDDADAWQGLIQIAVAAVHLQRGNPYGAQRLFSRAQTRLASYSNPVDGIDVAAARALCAEFIGQIDQGAHGTVELPPLPVLAAGFDLSPAFASQPIDTDPIRPNSTKDDA